jgi:hypothetical protein
MKTKKEKGGIEKSHKVAISLRKVAKGGAVFRTSPTRLNRF